MNEQSRRKFLQTSALGLAAAGALPACSAKSEPSARSEKPEILFKLGIASYTFRKFSLEDTLAMTKRLEIKNLAFKSFHLPLDSTPEEIAATVEKVKEAGLNLYGCGVVYMINEEEVNNAFEYARLAGMKVIIGVPEHDLLPLVEEKVKEYDIQVAIHNHGPGDDVYPTPASIAEKVSGLDPRIGICIDIGHTVRIGSDLFQETDEYFDRILDVHIKDVSEASAEGETIEIGRGIIDIPAYLKLLVDKGYSRMVSFEFEKDEDDPLAGLAESVGYVRGVLDTMV